MRRKRLYRVMIIIVFFIILLGILIRYLSSPIVERIIRNTLDAKPIAGHTIDFQKFRVNPYTVSASIWNLTIRPDSGFFADTIPEQLKYHPIIEFDVEKVSLQRLHLFKIIFGKKLIVRNILISGPKIQFVNSKFPKPIENQEVISDTIPEEVPEGVIKAVDIGSIRIEKGNFSLANYGKEPMLFSRDYSILVENIIIDLEDQKEMEFTFESEPVVNISLRENEFQLPGDLYSLKVHEILLNDQDSSLTINDLALIPMYDKEEFGWKNGTQTDRFDVKIDEISFKGIYIGELIHSRVLNVYKMILRNADLNLYRDKNVPFDMSKFPKLPHQGLTSMKFPLLIDTVALENVNLVYEEVPEKGDKPGVISLMKSNLSVVNVTNFQEAIDSNESMVIEGDFMLQDKAKMYITVDMPLNQKVGEFHFYGGVEEFDLPILNSMTENSIKILTHSGHVNNFQFDIWANQSKAEGTVKFYYTDLNMAVLKGKQKDSDHIAVKGFLSSIANAAVRKNNPHENKAARIAKVEWERDMNKGIVNLMVKPIIQGIITTVSPGNKKVIHEGSQETSSKKEQKKEGHKKKKKQK